MVSRDDGEPIPPAFDIKAKTMAAAGVASIVGSLMVGPKALIVGAILGIGAFWRTLKRDVMHP